MPSMGPYWKYIPFLGGYTERYHTSCWPVVLRDTPHFFAACGEVYNFYSYAQQVTLPILTTWAYKRFFGMFFNVQY